MPVTADAPSWTVAVTVAAPATTPSRFTEALPVASVKAVALAGIKLPIAVFVVNVTTAPATAAPAPSNTVAVTLTGLPITILLTAAPVAGFVNANETEPTLTV